MAVYRHTYQPYEGVLAPAWSRFLILPRYAYEDLFRSKLFATFFVLCFIAPLAMATVIYLRHNATVLSAFKIPVADLFPINEKFFLGFMVFQGQLAFWMTAFVGPGLISPDLVNNALPLYLSRPFTRAEYVASKLLVLAGLLSLMTWVPGLLLFLLQSNLEGGGWMAAHARIASAIFFGFWIWIGMISLLALALSAWVRWRPVAGALLFGVFFGAAAFGVAINRVIFDGEADWGHLINLGELIKVIWTWLFFGEQAETSIPAWSAGLSLAGIGGLCLLLLGRKLRAYEVVR